MLYKILFFVFFLCLLVSSESLKSEVNVDQDLQHLVISGNEAYEIAIKKKNDNEMDVYRHQLVVARLYYEHAISTGDEELKNEQDEDKLDDLKFLHNYAYIQLGNTYVQFGLMKKAKDMHVKASELYPNHSHVHLIYRYLDDQSNDSLNKALTLIDQQLQLPIATNPTDEDKIAYKQRLKELTILKGVALYQLRKYEESCDVFNEIDDFTQLKEPLNKIYIQSYADALYRTNDHIDNDKALSMLKTAKKQKIIRHPEQRGNLRYRNLHSIAYFDTFGGLPTRYGDYIKLLKEKIETFKAVLQQMIKEEDNSSSFKTHRRSFEHVETGEYSYFPLLEHVFIYNNADDIIEGQSNRQLSGYCINHKDDNEICQFLKDEKLSRILVNLLDGNVSIVKLGSKMHSYKNCEDNNGKWTLTIPIYNLPIDNETTKQVRIRAGKKTADPIIFTNEQFYIIDYSFQTEIWNDSDQDVYLLQIDLFHPRHLSAPYNIAAAKANGGKMPTKQNIKADIKASVKTKTHQDL